MGAATGAGAGTAIDWALYPLGLLAGYIGATSCCWMRLACSLYFMSSCIAYVAAPAAGLLSFAFARFFARVSKKI
jgi:hypothetical protein